MECTKCRKRNQNKDLLAEPITENFDGVGGDVLKECMLATDNNMKLPRMTLS